MATAMAIASVITKIAPLVVDAVLAAEKLYRGAKQGALKKEYALRLVRDGIGAAGEFSDLVKNHEESLNVAIAEMLEATVKFLNATGVLGREYEFDLSDAT